MINEDFDAQDLANWDCCDEHETVFPKGQACPKCEDEPEAEDQNLLSILRAVCESWVNGRKVLDGIPKTVADRARAVL